MANPFNVLNETTPGARIGTSLGEGFGQGLSTGLQMLAQQKLGEIAQRNQINKASQFWQQAGLSPRDHFIFDLPPARAGHLSCGAIFQCVACDRGPVAGRVRCTDTVPDSVDRTAFLRFCREAGYRGWQDIGISH